MVMMVESCEKPDKQRTARPRQPVQNPAYSGHTAWVMGVMSELAYMRFEVEDLGALLALPAELGKAMGRPPSNSEFQEIEGVLATRDNKDCRLLRAVLAAGGFELVGVLSNHGTDTQGFVAVRRVGDELDMAVVSFRGTENVQDWMTNLDYSLTPADSPQAGGRESTGKFTRGSLKPSGPARARWTGICKARRDSLSSSPAIPWGVPWRRWGRLTCPAGAWRLATPSERLGLVTRRLPATCELPSTAWSIPGTRFLMCRPRCGDTVMPVTGEDLGGHLLPTRCEKSGTAWFGCGD